MRVKHWNILIVILYMISLIFEPIEFDEEMEYYVDAYTDDRLFPDNAWEACMEPTKNLEHLIIRINWDGQYIDRTYAFRTEIYGTY